MFSRRMLSLSSLAGRRIVTGLALVAYVASTTGYPLPLPAGDQDTSTPYPCQGHACGCQSAAQCWDNCCCYSPAERLAWIRSHDVALPATTVAALRPKPGRRLRTAFQTPRVTKNDSCGRGTPGVARIAHLCPQDEHCQASPTEQNPLAGSTASKRKSARG